MESRLQLKDAVEAVFGPGAFALIDQGEFPDDIGCETPDPDPPSPVDGDETGGSPMGDRQAADVPRPIAREPSAGSQAAGTTDTVLLLELSGAWFALPIAHVIEVQRLPRVTRLPCVPEWLRGVANLRGSIVSVVDLHRFLGSSPRAETADEFLVIVRSVCDQMTTGLVVDKVLGIRGIGGRGDESLAPMRFSTGFVSQLTTCDGRRVAVVDVERFLSSTEMRRFCPAGLDSLGPDG